jgi:hypothetical protein
MTVKAIYESGVFRPTQPVNLPEHAEVQVVLPPLGTAMPLEELPAAAQSPTWGEVFGDLIGAVEGLPEDLAENHDHYIHGAPKR